MARLGRSDVAPLEPALQQAPEVLYSVRVDLAARLGFHVLDDLMDKIPVEVVVKDGVLTVTLPIAEAAKPKRVDIRVN